MEDQTTINNAAGGQSDSTTGLEDNGPRFSGLTMSVMLDRLHTIYGVVSLARRGSGDWKVAEHDTDISEGPTPFAAVYFAYKPHHNGFAEEDREMVKRMRELLSFNA